MGPVKTYERLVGKIMRARDDYLRMVSDANLLRSSIEEEDRNRIETLHGIEWVNGRPMDLMNPMDRIDE